MCIAYRQTNTHTHTHRLRQTDRHTRCLSLSSWEILEPYSLCEKHFESVLTSFSRHNAAVCFTPLVASLINAHHNKNFKHIQENTAWLKQQSNHIPIHICSRAGTKPLNIKQTLKGKTILRSAYNTLIIRKDLWFSLLRQPTLLA